MRKSDRYLKIVEWSEEDQCYVGTCPGLMFGGIHGDDEAEVYKELSQAVEEWIDIYEQDGDPLPEATAGKEYSGKFVVRVGKDLHKALAIGAMHHGESLNEHCVHLLREESAKYKASKR
jgi:predicted HicB family RNase H-like nuclease